MNEQNINLTSSEIGSLWTGYMQDSLSKQLLAFMMQYIVDPDIKSVVQHSYNLSSTHLETLESIFEAEQYAVPNGFTEHDVNMNAPWLFTDLFCLTYVNHMARIGMPSHSEMAAVSYRKDIRNYFLQCLSEVSNLYDQSLEISLVKGVSPRHPYMEVPKETDYIDSKKYMSGLNPFSEKRPLNAIEISHLYFSVISHTIGTKLCLAFAQTSSSKEIQDFMLRAKEITQKHRKLFEDNLLEDNIEKPNLPDINISDSTTQTFSDKAMMFQASLLAATGMGSYGMAAAASQRSDLAMNYSRLSMEISRLAKSGADIMIKHNWLEQPPGVKDKEKLARNKQKG